MFGSSDFVTVNLVKNGTSGERTTVAQANIFRKILQGSLHYHNGLFMCIKCNHVRYCTWPWCVKPGSLYTWITRCHLHHCDYAYTVRIALQWWYLPSSSHYCGETFSLSWKPHFTSSRDKVTLGCKEQVVRSAHSARNLFPLHHFLETWIERKVRQIPVKLTVTRIAPVVLCFSVSKSSLQDNGSGVESTTAGTPGLSRH